ncbi:unnamed protein product, partial [Meganyctiphanes norvegica]
KEESKKPLEDTAFNQQHSKGYEAKLMQQVAREESQKIKIKLYANATKCFCGRFGNWYDRMLECQRCKRWFHETCIGCLHYKLICGDRFYLYVCEFCNNGREFLHRIYLDWGNIVHLALWNLSISRIQNGTNGRYYGYEEHIATWVNTHWEELQCSPEKLSIPIRDRTQYILLALQGNSTKFKCGKEVRKKSSIWSLKVTDPPSVPEIILPPESPMTEALLPRIKYCERTTKLTPIPKTFKVDAADPVLLPYMKQQPQVGPSSVVDLDNEDDNKVSSASQNDDDDHHNDDGPLDDHTETESIKRKEDYYQELSCEPEIIDIFHLGNENLPPSTKVGTLEKEPNKGLISVLKKMIIGAITNMNGKVTLSNICEWIEQHLDIPKNKKLKQLVFQILCDRSELFLPSSNNWKLLKPLLN